MRVILIKKNVFCYLKLVEKEDITIRYLSRIPTRINGLKRVLNVN